MKIGCQLTEKSTKNMRSWLITFNVTLGIILFVFIGGLVEKKYKKQVGLGLHRSEESFNK